MIPLSFDEIMKSGKSKLCLARMKRRDECSLNENSF